jgi:predicted membrane protein
MNDFNNSSEQPGSATDQPRHYWGHHQHGGADSRIFLGIILVLAGAVLIADNLNLLSYDMSHILISWPMLAVAVGLFNLARRHYSSGFIIFAIGLFFLMPRIFDVPEDFTRNFWPIVLIAIGIIFLFRRNHHWHEKWHREKSTNDSIDETAIFGGRDVSIVNDNFTGGKITSIFGGSKINLLYAKPAPGCTIDIEAIFGGAKLIVPEDWNIKVEITPMFGGFEDRRSPSVISRSDPNKTVVIKGTCIFGGGEITSMP